MLSLQAASALGALDGARAAVVAARLADAMGLRKHQLGMPLTADAIREVAAAAAAGGIGEHIAAADEVDPHRLLEALEASPMPAPETRHLASLLGYVSLSALAGASEPSLRRYAAGERVPTDRVAQRVHFLALLVAVLRGSFNEFGIRRWFERRRTTLDGLSPADLLRDDWSPDDPGPQAAAQLAATLLT